jgi:hypothetical protein
MAKKFIESVTTTTRNEGSNQQPTITETKKVHLITLTDADKFFMVYLSMLRSFYEIKYVKDVFILVKMAEMAEYNTGNVKLTMDDRADICKTINIKSSNLSASLTRLISMNLLAGGKGKYTINAGLFWKGDSKERKRLLLSKGLDFNIKFKIEPNTNFDDEADEKN